MRYGGEVYRFIFAARAESDAFARGAEETLRSFRATTQNDLAQIQRITVKIITAQPGDTADTLANRMANLTDGVDLFYILNNLYPGDPVEAGTRYKIVVVN
jgi:predicted Zn-dependent protease